MKKSVFIIAAFALGGCAGFSGDSSSGAAVVSETDSSISSGLLEKSRTQSAASHATDLDRRYNVILESVDLDFTERRETISEKIAAMHRSLDEKARIDAERLGDQENLAREVALFGHCQALLLEIEQIEDDLAEKEGYIVGRQESGTNVFFGQSLSDAAAQYAALVGQHDATVRHFERLDCNGFPNFAGVEFPSYATPGQ